MKMFMISLAIAFALALPKIGVLCGFDVPLAAWLGIPAAGLGYLLVFFHELGHTAAFWLFGYASVPTFDFNHGGGYTYAMSRSWLVLAVVWICAAFCAGRWWRDQDYTLLGWLAGGLLLHGLLMLSSRDQALISFAGHAGEILVAGFCMLRAFMGTTEKSRGSVERWLNMVFGCFVLVYDTVFTAALMFNKDYRNDYAGQKGGHLAGDLDQIALSLHIPFGGVAFLLMVFNFAVFAAAIYIGLQHTPHEDHVRAAARRKD